MSVSRTIGPLVEISGAYLHLLLQLICIMHGAEND